MNDDLCVFVIDDNAVERALLSGLLKKVRRWQISCVSCASGKEALQRARTQKPHVIFVDYRLEGERGPDVILQFRQAGCRAGFVLFTGTSGEEALLEALRAGADDYLHKTDICLETVSRALHHALEKTKTTLALEEALDGLRQAKEALEDRVKARTSQLQETQEKLNIITSAAFDPILLLDHHARIIFWNPAAEKSFGYSADEMIGRDIFSLLPPADFKTRLNPTDQLFFQTDSGSMVGHVSEFMAIRKNGERFPVSASLSPIQTPEGWHTVVIPRDMTKRYASEAALRQAKEEAEEATRLKDRFVSLVAHDLRGPFTSILGFLELLGNDKKNPLNKKQKEFLRWIVISCQKMVQMIDEILDISRIKTGKIVPRFKFINARFLSNTLLENLFPMAEKKGITLENNLAENSRLYADPSLFGEVLRNLLVNAIKFCRHGDSIVVYCLDHEKTTIVVRDSGVGIAKDRQKAIFLLEEKTTTVGTAGEHGTGLGLPFSLELMKAHGGSLWVESQEGKGSAFFAHLPEVVPQVLVVDDDEDFRQLLLHRLRSERVGIMEASNGIVALRLTTEHNFHLIIADIQMPDMDGFDLLKELRNKPETRSIPTILVTGDETIATREKAFQMGADDFITKPLDYPDFLPRVRRFLNKGCQNHQERSIQP